MDRLCIKIHELDNVAVAIRDLSAGTEVMPGLVTVCDIPQAHKIALTDIPAGGQVFRYGVLLGTMKEDMPKGGWINENNLVMAPAPDLDQMEFATNLVTDLPAAPVIKVCSRNEMKEQWPDIIDFYAGPAAMGDKTIAEQGVELFMYIIDVASGRKKPYSEQYKWVNDICVFNPAPIT